ncbi:MAG: NAD-dependent epimerase/dehydratase family protein [Gammaproteobacteria bacterium]|nr:NAD-dependent epimerase/dehydratase family protein [Gammaproteobacteria bacterium]NND36531.1 NAD-dependent epimerase/dehydratase family protein [Gammaproteobacteria bacterium]
MKIAIIGAAYTGKEAARYLRSKGHTISVTTTNDGRVAELEPLADRVVVMRGNDRDKMRELIAGQDAVLVTVAGGMVERDGQYVMDLDLYTDTYVGTAQCLVACLDAAPGLRQIIFTGSWSVYGNAGGAEHVDEDTPVTPGSPFQQVYADTENILFGAQTPELGVCVYRTGTIYGPNAGFVPRELKSQALPLAGQTVPFDGESPATIIHRDDVVKALEFALDNRLAGVYNLVNDISDTKASYMGAIVAAAGGEPINWVGHGTGPKTLSNQKIKDAGYVFLDPLAERDGQALL